MTRSLAVTASAAFLVALTACVTSTPYQLKTDGKDYGVSYEEKEGRSKYAVFSGNGSTSKTDGLMYSVLAAYDFCEFRRQTALIFDMNDQTSSTSYLSSYSTPIYGPSGKYVGQNTTVTPRTATFPKYRTAFMCFDHFHITKQKFSTENLSREVVSAVTKDFKGGLLVKKAEPASGLNDGDVIISVDKTRVEKYADYFEALQALPAGKVSLTILRNQKKRAVEVETFDDIASLRGSSSKTLEFICSRVSPETVSYACQIHQTIAGTK